MNALKKIRFLYLLFAVLSCLLHGQDNIPPERPYLTYVTVDTTTNNTHIFWSESTSPDLEWYYLYYEVNTVNGPEGVKFDSVAPGNTSYIHITDGSQESVIYSISAIDTAGNESVRTPGFHSTIHANIFYDSCFDAITLRWNQYTGWGNNLSGYRVYSRMAGGAYGNPAGAGKLDTIYTFNNISPNTLYFFFIEAVKNDTLISRSALAAKYTHMPGPPDNFELIDVDAISPGAVEINFEYTDTSGINDFRLLRSFSESADFVSVVSLYDLNDGPNTFTDSIITGVDSYYYRIGALNSCNKVISESNFGRNIVLTGTNDGNENIVEWNPYEDWTDGVETYELRIVNDDGTSELIYNAPPGVYNFEHDLRTLFGTGFEGRIRYQVAAKKNGEEVYSVSNILEIQAKTGITVPNAFTPNNDGRNDTFKPVFTLFPEKYLMVIYDRYGIIVFKSKDPALGWDGRINGGEMAIEGVYVYHIQYTSHNGTAAEETGQLTLFYP
jgi:gliding motility-associated-like protein